MCPQKEQCFKAQEGLTGLVFLMWYSEFFFSSPTKSNWSGSPGYSAGWHVACTTYSDYFRLLYRETCQGGCRDHLVGPAVNYTPFPYIVWLKRLFVLEIVQMHSPRFLVTTNVTTKLFK